MADAICRWRNPFLKNVRLLIDCLPKLQMTSEEGRELTNKNFGSSFFGAPYQSACQLGLYYEENGMFYPRYYYQPTDDEIYKYLRNWILLYPAPNPYTNGFKKLEPFSIHNKLCELLIKSKSPINWEEALNIIFQENIGNKDILKNSINNYSSVIQIDGTGVLKLKPAITYDNLKDCPKIIHFSNRDDKKSFFNLFDFQTKDLSDVETKDLFIDEVLCALSTFNQDDRETVKEAIVKVRINQSKFRNDLLDSDRNRCPFTKIEKPELLLIAGHIKPWKVSTNPERLDPDNGILLTPTFDKLFDKFLISFDKYGKVIFSQEIDKDTWLNLFPKFEDIQGVKININEKNKIYLEFHRTKFNDLNK